MALKISITDAPEDPAALEAAVDQEIRDFDTWFQGLGNDPLIGPEKAIVKTFVGWKLGLKKGE